MRDLSTKGLKKKIIFGDEKREAGIFLEDKISANQAVDCWRLICARLYL